MVAEAFEFVAVPFNFDGWGPPDASDVSSSASSTSVAAANLLPNVPFASFSRSDKLGRVADWTRNLSNPSARPPTGSKSDPSAVFDFSAFAIDEGFGLASSGGNPDEDAAFRLVDGKPPPRPKFGPKWRFNPHHNRNQLPQRRDEEVEAKKRDAEKERARRDRLYNLNRNNIHHQRREAAAFKSRVLVVNHSIILGDEYNKEDVLNKAARVLVELLQFMLPRWMEPMPRPPHIGMIDTTSLLSEPSLRRKRYRLKYTSLSLVYAERVYAQPWREPRLHPPPLYGEPCIQPLPP